MFAIDIDTRRLLFIIFILYITFSIFDCLEDGWMITIFLDLMSLIVLIYRRDAIYADISIKIYHRRRNCH
ncbi:hypothetical protein HOLleu_36611 [Holothuria leucospilota]|uniref:Uncharacterized protein n=1 Tax=Holothuria leucospilota TaxID=206669 RepID=A0A9Q0YK37_HOLLE|nr:hypothetical protein HOLleu_36611 [Holothuria leucospilota]